MNLAMQRPKSSPILFSEKCCQNKLLLLSNYSPNISFKQEVSVPNTLDSSSKTRRFDLVQYLPDLTRIYEIKKDRIELEMVKEVLETKQYLELAKRVFGNVELVFVSPRGCSKDAQREIDQYGSVYFLHAYELSNILHEDYKRSLPPEAIWMAKRVKEEFSLLLK
jgi:hypothetical protein